MTNHYSFEYLSKLAGQMALKRVIKIADETAREEAYTRFYDEFLDDLIHFDQKLNSANKKTEIKEESAKVETVKVEPVQNVVTPKQKKKKRKYVRHIVAQVETVPAQNTNLQQVKPKRKYVRHNVIPQNSQMN